MRPHWRSVAADSVTRFGAQPYADVYRNLLVGRISCNKDFKPRNCLASRLTIPAGQLRPQGEQTTAMIRLGAGRPGL